MDPDQAAPTVSVWFGSTLFVNATSNILVDDKNIHFLVCALRVNKCALCVFTVMIFMKCTHVCAAQTTYLFFTKL